MEDPVNFCAQCPACKNEAAQGHERQELGTLLKENRLAFYCDACDLEWVPTSQELANVEMLLRGSSCEPLEDPATTYLAIQNEGDYEAFKRSREHHRCGS